MKDKIIVVFLLLFVVLSLGCIENYSPRGDQTIGQGEKMTFDIKFDSPPNRLITWTFNGISKSENLKTNNKKSTQYILDTTGVPIGAYKLEMESPGDESVYWNIIIAEPTMATKMKNIANSTIAEDSLKYSWRYTWNELNEIAAKNKK